MNTKYDKVLGMIREVDGNASEFYVGAEWSPMDPNTAWRRVGNPDILVQYLQNCKVVALTDAGVENATLATYSAPTLTGAVDGSNGQVMVKFPKLYFKEAFGNNGGVGAGAMRGVYISLLPLDGFTAHPKFTWGNGRQNIYIGAYEASNSGGNVLQSISGAAVLANIDLATFRSRAVARGTGWHGYDFYSHHLLQLLFYVYYAHANSQFVLPGYTEASAWADAYRRATGRSNTLATINGSIDADLAGVDSDLVAGGITAGEKVANRFLWIENIFGHIWKFTDGVAYDGRVGQPNTAWVTPNPTLFSSVEANILANYTNLGVALPAATNEAYMQELQTLFLPKTHGGASTTYITDYFYSYLDDASRNYLRVVLVGSDLHYGGRAGVAARYAVFGLGHAYSTFGSRLCFESN